MNKRIVRVLSFALSLVVTLLCLSSCGNHDGYIDSSTPEDVETATIHYPQNPNPGGIDMLRENSFTFRDLPIGGGGYVTGMVIHPLDSTIKYIRTDVGGAYRWNESEGRWDPMTDFFGNSQSLLYGIDGIAIDPNNKDIVYICCGDGGNAAANGYPALYKSTDRGQSFKRTSLEVTFFGNGGHREAGECIMVDPNNSNVIYVGSRTMGLYVSTDAAETWTRIESVPTNGASNIGIRGIVIDQAETVNGRSKNIYVSIPGGAEDSGLYVSRDGGVSFKKIEGSPKTIKRMVVPSDGRVYLSSSTGLFVYDGNSFKDISPDRVEKNKTYHALAVYPDDPNKIIVCNSTTAEKCMNLNIFYSNDGGKTWSQKNTVMEKIDKVPWWPDYYFSSATCALIFDPQNPKEVYFTDWYGVWMTKDIEAKKVSWYSKVKGHEECVVFDIQTVPVGDVEVITGVADNGGMYYTNINEYPLQRRNNQVTSIDFCESQPNIVIMCGSDHNNNKKGGIFVSTDYGKTYKVNSAWGTDSAMRIAVSATDPGNWVIESINKDVMYTLDGGKTFHKSEGAPKNLITDFWGAGDHLCSDRVKGGTFYIACKDGFYRSDDGGKTFEKVSAATNSSTPVAAPGKAGYVYIKRDGYILGSEDYGATFKIIKDIKARSISFGPGKTNSSEPVMYLLGSRGTEEGLFASEDMGKTIIRVSDDDHKLGKGGFIHADRRRYGRVYIGTGGRGIIIAEATK